MDTEHFFNRNQKSFHWSMKKIKSLKALLDIITKNTSIETGGLISYTYKIGGGGEDGSTIKKDMK